MKERDYSSIKILLMEDNQEIGCLTPRFHKGDHQIYAYICMLKGRKERAYGLPAFFDIWYLEDEEVKSKYLNCYFCNFESSYYHYEFIILKHIDIYFQRVEE